MPKDISKAVLSGLFGVCKPSGPTSMAIVNELQRILAGSSLFVDSVRSEDRTKAKRKPRPRDLVKVGQGGTLDPLADGVLVIGVNRGTKTLSDFLQCTKENSYDSEGAIVRTAKWKHVTREMVQSKLSLFTGNIQQKPPIFSALKIDGKPLYEYAREGLPLPRPIEARPVQVHSLEIESWLGSDHQYTWPTKTIDPTTKQAMQRTLDSTSSSAEDFVDLGDTCEDEAEGAGGLPPPPPTAFVLKMSVSGGTYVRSIVHDLAHAVGSAGHVVTLSRLRQGRYTLVPSQPDDKECIPWEVFEKAVAETKKDDQSLPKSAELAEWEQMVRERLEKV